MKKTAVSRRRVSMASAIMAMVFAGFFCPTAKAQQDIQFSQYVFNGLSLNPGYAGYKENTYFNSVYRKQWINFPGAPASGAVSVDGLLDKESKTHGIGGQIAWDKLGPQQQRSLFASYAYRIQMDADDSKRLCLGLGLGIDQYVLDGSALVANDAGDQSIPTGTLSAAKPDARVGAYYFTEKFYAGLSFMNLFSLNGERTIFLNKSGSYPIQQKNTHMYFTMGMLTHLGENLKVKPSIMLKEDFHGPTSLDLNLFFLLSEKLWTGASYRSALPIWNKKAVDNSLSKSGALSLMFEFLATERFRFGYSYDIITSGLSGYQAGSHELSLGLLFIKATDDERIKSPRYF